MTAAAFGPGVPGGRAMSGSATGGMRAAAMLVPGATRGVGCDGDRLGGAGLTGLRGGERGGRGGEREADAGDDDGDGGADHASRVVCGRTGLKRAVCD